jgi:hypothetical protein
VIDAPGAIQGSAGLAGPQNASADPGEYARQGNAGGLRRYRRMVRSRAFATAGSLENGFGQHLAYGVAPPRRPGTGRPPLLLAAIHGRAPPMEVAASSELRVAVAPGHVEGVARVVRSRVDATRAD